MGKIYAVFAITLVALKVQAVWAPYASNSIPWTPGVYAGNWGGIPTPTTIYTNVAPAAGAAGIQTALNNCPSNQIVNLHTNAVYDIGAAITIGNVDGKHLFGNGSKLRATTGISRYFAIGADLNWGSRINITDGWVKGSSNLTLASVSGVAVGQLCLVDQTNEAKLVWDRTGGSTRCMSQIMRVEAINGSVVTVWPPLYYSGPTNTPQFRITTDHARRCSVRDLFFDNNGNTVNEGVWIHHGESIYLHKLRMTNMNTYNILITRAVFTEISQCVMWDSPTHGPNHAGLLVGSTSTDMGSHAGFYYDNIIHRIFPGIEGNRASGNVYAYNFINDAFYDDFGQGVGLDVNHLPHPQMNLSEGNVVNMIQNDGYFGSASHNTYFRNWSHGYVTHGLGGVASNFNSKAVCLNHYSLYEAVVGNVLGYPTFTPTHYVVTNDDYAASQAAIYQFGYPNMGGNNYSGTFVSFDDHQMTGEDQRLDYRVGNTVLLHGNWDSLNRSITWSNGLDQVLPDSLIYAAKPAWFYGMRWPPIVPANGFTNWTITGAAPDYRDNVIPAVYRFFNNGADPPADTSGPRSTASGRVNFSGRVKVTTQ